MGFDHEKENTINDWKGKKHEDHGHHEAKKIEKQMSEASLSATDQEDQEDEDSNKLQLGPQYTLKEQIEKDKVNIYFGQTSIFMFFCITSFSLIVLFT